ncbi:MAG: hypothetical protein EXS37_19265 [Opitutus sp.]|nr:hypothetical protein [Opitutus sp.]
MSRLATPSVTPRFVPFKRPFSNFDFVEKEFSGSPPIRRLFSQARSRNATTLVFEEVLPDGAVADECAELLALFPDYAMGGLRRISFWKAEFHTEADLAHLKADDCIGWAILKQDCLPSKQLQRWHVFESVIRKYAHEHNYVPCSREIRFRVGACDFSLPGVLYCQQNALNKACAQVALRSICSAYLNDPNLTFRRINELAFAPHSPVNPGDGLDLDPRLSC